MSRGHFDTCMTHMIKTYNAENSMNIKQIRTQMSNVYKNDPSYWECINQTGQ